MCIFINAARLAIIEADAPIGLIFQTESYIYRTANSGSLENVEERACSYFEAGDDCVLISGLGGLTSGTRLTRQTAQLSSSNIPRQLVRFNKLCRVGTGLDNTGPELLRFALGQIQATAWS